MALQFSSGSGTLYEKDFDQPISRVSYQLIETEQSKYARKKWWGELYSVKEISRNGAIRIELEDGRAGECIVWSSSDSDIRKGASTQHHYHFNGRGKLSKGLRK